MACTRARRSSLPTTLARSPDSTWNGPEVRTGETPPATARMVRRRIFLNESPAARRKCRDVDDLDFPFIENAGNLVCIVIMIRVRTCDGCCPGGDGLAQARSASVV